MVAVTKKISSHSSYLKRENNLFLWTLLWDGQGGVACCDSWGHKESDTTEQLNWTELNWWDHLETLFSFCFLSCLHLGCGQSCITGHISAPAPGKGKGMWKSPHPDPALAHVTSAYVSPVRTQSMVTPSCKGGWECIRLQLCHSIPHPSTFSL